MKTPHKHAAVIHAWADGATVQYRTSAEHNWADSKEPSFFDEVEYRIKPEPKPDVVSDWIATGARSATIRYAEHWEIPNLKLTFDGETGKLKSAEVV